jgi:hypothetical protein
VTTDPNPFGDRERLGILEHEATAVCPVAGCGDIDCMTHTPEQPSPAELALTDAVETIQKAKDAAEVVEAALRVLQAWDVDNNLPKRIQSALAHLDDAMARYQRIPF